MNAPATIRRAPTLDDLKAERAMIRERLASIKESRAKLGEADTAVEAARNELNAFADHHANRIDEWAGSGCKGPRPAHAFSDHAALEAKLNRALHAADTNRAALNTLDAREAEARRALFEIERPIRIAAVEIICSKLDVLADKTIALREKLTANEESLLAAHVLLRDQGKTTDSNGITKVDSDFYLASQRIRGIELPGREEWCPINAESSKYWKEMLDELVSKG